MLLKHVLRFPNVKRVVYSTCSINSEENEAVIEDALMQFQSRFRLKKIMPDWPHRGIDGFKHSQFYLRMWPEKDLTNGFFVACLERIGCNNMITARSRYGTPSGVEIDVEDYLKTDQECISEDTRQIQDVNTSKRKKSKKRERSVSEVNNLDKVEQNGENNAHINKKAVDCDLSKNQKRRLKRNQRKGINMPSIDDRNDEGLMNKYDESIMDEHNDESNVKRVSKKKSKKKYSPCDSGPNDVVNAAGCEESLTCKIQLDSNVGNDSGMDQLRKKKSRKRKNSKIDLQTETAQQVDLDKSCQIIEMDPIPHEVILLDTPFVKKSKKHKKKKIRD